jgi:cytoskeleton protein RodZ
MSTKRPPHSDDEAPSQEDASFTPPSASRRDHDRIGDILRRVREHRGETIEEIADYLCIRANFLQALEGSHYEFLPADAYVIGFLRTYATYLDLDGRAAVDQYRREMAGRRRKPQLSMPQPMSEGRTPTLALLIGGLLAALIVYGVWYGLSTPERDVLEAPLPLPSAASDLSAGDDAQIAESSVYLETATLPSVKEIDPIIIEAEEQKEEPAKEDGQPKAAEKETSNGIALNVSPEEIKADTKDIQQEEKTPEETPPPTEGQTYGTQKPAAVVLKAEEESWILITDDKGLTVFDRTLKIGDVYNVPSYKGLRLTTGNPKGLRITINGKDMPKIKVHGKVARGLVLEPSKFTALLEDMGENEKND